MYSILRSIRMGSMMAVAVMGGIDWAVYEGLMQNHLTQEENEQAIAAHGNKLHHTIARDLFPEFSKEPYRR